MRDSRQQREYGKDSSNTHRAMTDVAHDGVVRDMAERQAIAQERIAAALENLLVELKKANNAKS